jgi:GPH family glycoside/pentoside/hexuronide:cation symporter
LVFYTPDNPYLSLIPGLLVVPGMTAIWVLIPSMTGDCVDEDQLRTDRRREGSFQSTFSWVLRVSTALATLISGPLVVLVGYNAALKGALQPESVIFKMRILLAIAPAAIMGLALWMIHKYPLTPQRIAEVKSELDQRRANAATPPV